MAEHIYHTMNKLNKTAINIELHTFCWKVYFITLYYFQLSFALFILYKHKIQIIKTPSKKQTKQKEHSEQSIDFA